MGFGGIISFLIFEKIEQIVKEKGVEAYGIEKEVYSKICALKFSVPKMEQTDLPESFYSFLTCTISISQTAE